MTTNSSHPTSPIAASFDRVDAMTYLDTASRAPRLLRARAVALTWQEQSVFSAAPSIAAWLARRERVRALFASLVCADRRDIALVSSVAFGMSTMAANVPLNNGQRVLVVADEHPSNILPWLARCTVTGARLARIERAGSQSWTDAMLSSMDDDVAVVVVPICHWYDGLRFDLARLADATHSIGAALAVDATQQIGVGAIDIPALHADLVVCAAQKWLLGPAGIAYLWVAPRWQQGQPLEYSTWNSAVPSPERAIGDGLDFAIGASRFDASSVLSGSLLEEAAIGLQAVTDWQPDAIQGKLRAWHEALTSALANATDRIRLVSDQSPQLMQLRATSWDSQQLHVLRQQLQERGVLVAARGGGLRISPYLHNHPDDAHRVVEELHRLTR